PDYFVTGFVVTEKTTGAGRRHQSESRSNLRGSQTGKPSAMRAKVGRRSAGRAASAMIWIVTPACRLSKSRSRWVNSAANSFGSDTATTAFIELHLAGVGVHLFT